MLASVVTGQYCSVHQLLFISSLAGMAFLQLQRISRTPLATRCRWLKPPVPGVWR